VRRLLPQQLRPTLVAASAVVGVCLVRLRGARPRGVPMPGFTSEGAAHRVGVEWDTPDGVEKGVYIWRRHTSSPINRLLGGRAFPGAHDRGRFLVSSTGSHLAITVEGVVDVEVSTERPFESEVFDDFGTASSYFEDAPIGISPRRAGGLEAMRLHTNEWSIEPAALVRAQSTFYDDTDCFPAGSIELDSALVMKNVPATWTTEEIPTEGLRRARLRLGAVGRPWDGQTRPNGSARRDERRAIRSGGR
jgi:hypothetical protein